MLDSGVIIAITTWALLASGVDAVVTEKVPHDDWASSLSSTARDISWRDRIGDRRFRSEAPFVYLAFSPDNTSLVSVDSVARIRVWDVPAKRLVRTIELDKGLLVRRLVFNRSGDIVALCGAQRHKGCVILYEWPRWTEIGRMSGVGPVVQNVAFCNNDSIIASVDLAGQVRLWDPKRLFLLREIAFGQGADVPKHRRDNFVSASAFSNDGRQAVVACRDRTIRIANIDTGGILVHPMDESGEVRQLSFTCDGKSVIIQRLVNNVCIWTPPEKETRVRYANHAYVVHAVAASPTRAEVVSISHDRCALWDARTGEEKVYFQSYPGGGELVAISLDGNSMACSLFDHTIGLWETRSGRPLVELHGHLGPVSSVAFVGDGANLVTASEDGTCRRWDIKTCQECGSFRFAEGPHPSSVFSLDGRTLVSAPGTGEIDSWDIGGSKRRGVGRIGGNDTVRSIAISPSGAMVGSKQDRLIGFWAKANQTKIIEISTDPQYTGIIAFSADDNLIAMARRDGEIWISHPQAGQVCRRLRGHSDEIACLIFSPDGNNLVSGGWDGAIHLWEVATGRRRWALSTNQGSILCIALDPERRVIAYGTEKGSLGIVDLISGKILVSINTHGQSVLSIAMHPNGRMLVTGSLDSTVSVWDINTGKRSSGNPSRPEQAYVNDRWSHLASNDAALAYKAMAELAGVSKDAVALFTSRLQPKRFDQFREIENLLQDLESDSFSTREEATKRLQEFGWDANAAVRRAAMHSRSPEVRRRAAHILKILVQAIPPSDKLQEFRALEVLEWIGSKAACQIVSRLATGAPDSPLSQKASAALKRIQLQRRAERTERPGGRPRPPAPAGPSK